MHELLPLSLDRVSHLPWRRSLVHWRVAHLLLEECHGDVLRSSLPHVGLGLPHDRSPLFLHLAPIALWPVQLHSPTSEGIWASLWPSPPRTRGVIFIRECVAMILCNNVLESGSYCCWICDPASLLLQLASCQSLAKFVNWPHTHTHIGPSTV